jgi:hypothetical protein
MRQDSAWTGDAFGLILPTAGSFNVDYVDGAWAENTIDASNAPPAGAANRFRCTSTPSPAAMVT